MTRILFLCSTNACRSQMAEGFAVAKKVHGVEIASAGTKGTSVNPTAIKVMKEAGVDISGQRSKSLDDLETLDFDIVITLCSEADRECPILPGNPVKVNWGLPDPAAVKGTEKQKLEAFKTARDRIRGLIDDLFDRGYLAALTGSRQQAEVILDNVSDGIIAHDMDRRVFHFNRAAEKITGYTREEVVNRDCHDVFPGHFCGPKCLFCDNAEPTSDLVAEELEIVTKSGEKRHVEMSVRTMVNTEGRRTGVLLSFKDTTRELRLARRAREIDSFSGMVGRDHKMMEVFDLIRDLADSNAPVLVQGESGTGKELVAAAIHNEGTRGDKLFVPVNCGALPESLLESELFGHVKGAFTGAIRDKKGRFELADEGTIFLDEIADIPPSMQVRLLRVLQEGTFERVGSEKTIKVNVRLISATNRILAEEIAAGRFREDLFYRLSVVPVDLPPLRERRNDIPLLVDHILRQELSLSGKKGITVSSEVIDVMMSYDWPGNVRELQNWIQFALVKCKGGEIKPEHLPPGTGQRTGEAAPPRRRRRRKLDIVSVRDALDSVDGNKVEAARVLGVSRATLYRFLDDVGEIT